MTKGWVNCFLLIKKSPESIKKLALEKKEKKDIIFYLPSKQTVFFYACKYLVFPIFGWVIH